MPGLVLMPVAAGAVTAAIAAMLYTDAQRSRQARIAPVSPGSLHPAVQRVVDASRHVWIWCAAWAWWARVTIGNAGRQAVVRLRATPAWPATERALEASRRRAAAGLDDAWAWWTQFAVGDAGRGPRPLDHDREHATRLPHDEVASRRRAKPRAVPSRSANSGLGDLDWSSLGRFSASARMDERGRSGDVDEHHRGARHRQSA